MAVKIAKTGQQNKQGMTALYCRLSDDDDDKDLESNSIINQKAILQDYAKRNGYLPIQIFTDDGISGLTFNRPGFREMEALVEGGEVTTIIVKDLSRFGRNYIEVGRYLEVIYPTLRVEFISIQESVNTFTGTNMETMPIHNVFNEWHCAQTSKKVRAVWNMKAQQHRRIGSTVAYGYKKHPEDREKWIIDEPAAKVVRHIYDLFMSGLGVFQIAKQLEREQVPTPSAYFHSIGRGTRNPMPEDPYRWAMTSVEHILDNRQYTGCIVNLASTSISYKVKKRIFAPPEELQILPNMHEPIIPEEVWQRVHELREHRHRLTKSGRASIFSGLVFCADCGAKMHYNAAQSLADTQTFFQCGNYHSGNRTCASHYIRETALSQMVLDAISHLADFVRCYEPVFLYLLYRKTAAEKKADLRRLNFTVETGKARIQEIDRLITRIYEDNVAGKLSDERFIKMSQSYEREQKELERTVAECEKALAKSQQDQVDIRLLLKGLREFTEVQELTPTLVNTLIQRIEVHGKEKVDGKVHMKVDVYFTGAGLIDIPTEREIRSLMDEAQKSAQEPLVVNT